MPDQEPFPSESSARLESGPVNKTEPPKVLVIDDDELALVVIRKLLEAENCVVDVFSSPQDALAKIPGTRYDAILCDMWMGEMNGKDFYQQLRQDFPEYQRRVIFVTGDLASEATWDFIDERHLPYILKPFSRPELRRKLHEVIGEWPAAAPAPDAAQSPWDGVERRGSRRFHIKAKGKVRRKKWAAGQPDVLTAANASREGILFISGREYRVGTEVWVAFPYTGREDDIEQEGFVVRVEELPQGRWGVAIAIGEGAEAARMKFECSQEDSRRHHILVRTAEQTPKPIPGSEQDRLKTSLAEEEARRLADELGQLKSTHDEVIDQRDRLAEEEANIKKQLEDLNSTKAAMTEVIDELKTQMETLQKDLAAGEDYRFQATHDSLTGAWNRAAILDFLKRELVRAQREGTWVGVILADLDHFKNVNDVYGHLAGDAVLREVAQRISACVREYDAVGRYGGEEFLVVLPGCEEEPVRHAERIRALVSAEPVSATEGAIPMTLSLGAALSSEALCDIEGLIRAADVALYRAKRSGRNRVEAASAAAEA